MHLLFEVAGNSVWDYFYIDRVCDNIYLRNYQGISDYITEHS
jgi:hypothetical protein